ncbi:hypothetical protein NKR23_g12183 [Pleurostoma richardsiae]|uniref:Uncharacterized protein n=1 Tax=Pleurostoma richardsiae TaxID=41990 RepID=A0AA38R9Z2_9PEZI|nr:hypothetical protein NKR23_g12183 [Pleurostoma richardsiae]
MGTRQPTRLKVLVEDDWLELDAAVDGHYESVLRAIMDAFLIVPVSPDVLDRIRFVCYFRQSLQKCRVITPYRLSATVADCQSGKAKEDSFAMKFFRGGGIRGVAALAAAGADNKDVGQLLSRLSADEVESLVQSIDTIKAHGDFDYIVETIRRKKPKGAAKRTYLPGSQPRKSRRKRSDLGKDDADAAGSLRKPDIEQPTHPTRTIIGRQLNDHTSLGA